MCKHTPDKFQFDLKENPNLARSFAHALKEEAAVGETNEIKKKLGHEPAFKPTKSIRYADTVAEEKRKHQPDPPVSTGDGIRETTLHIFMHISKNFWLFYNSNDNFKFLNPLMPYIPFKSKMRIYDLYLNFLTFVKNGK